MASEIIDTDNVSFLALLMAPDDSTIENPYETKFDSNEIHPSSSFNHHPTLDYHSSNNFMYPCDMNNNHPQFLNCGNNGFLPSIPFMPDFHPGYDTDYISALPDLHSLENGSERRLLKYPKHELPRLEQQQPAVDNYSLDSIVNEFLKNSSDRKMSEVTPSRRRKIGGQATNKRARVRAKMFALSKLLPAGYGSKTAIAETLEDTCKYIKFLQAQVVALQSMPAMSHIKEGDRGETGRGGGKLVSLTRQQLLQVVVNTPEAQVMMADKGLCVVSAEQVEIMKRVELKKKIVQHLLAQIPI